MVIKRKNFKRLVLRAKIAPSCLADLQNRALVRYTLACQVIINLAALAAHARAFLKSVRRLRAIFNLCGEF